MDPNTGRLKEGNYNCLAYCETVDSNWSEDFKSTKPTTRALPAAKKLIHTGNLAQPAGNGQPEILGSYVMDYRVFMETFLLPQLQELCQATYLQVGEANFSYDEAKKRKFMCPVYALGRELSGNPPRTSHDDIFKFKKKDCCWYQWDQPSSKGNRGNPHIFRTTAGQVLSYQGYIQYLIQANSTIDVKWVAGESTLEITGKIRYDDSTQLSSNPQITGDVEQGS